MAAVLPVLMTAALVSRDAVVPAEPARAPLPSGGLVTVWDIPIGEFSEAALDERSGSVALLDLADPLDRINGMQVVDAHNGLRRWGGRTDGQWVHNPDGSLAAVAGIGFLTSDKSRIYAVRLSTGRLAWKSDPGLGTAIALTGEHLILRTGTGVVALDPATGATRWQWTAQGTCSDSRFFVDNSAVTSECGEAVVRVGLNDGGVRWSRPTPDGCTLHDMVTGPGVVALSEICGPALRLVLLDGDTGAERASRHVAGNPAEGDDGLAYLTAFPAGTTTLVRVSTERGVLFRASDGTPLPLLDGQAPIAPDGGPAPDGLLLERGGAGGEVTLSLVDPGTGVARWERVLPYAGTRLDGSEGYRIRAAGGLLYLVGTVPTLWPNVVGLIDQRSGDLALSATGRADVEIAGVFADGSILLRSGVYDDGRLARIRLTGGATGFLGTDVAAARWPDACRLLSAADYRDAYPAGKPVVTPVTTQRRDAALPGPARCRFLPSSIAGTEVTVSVNWLFGNDDEAAKAVELFNLYSRDPTPATVGTARRPALRWDDLSGDGSETGDHHRLSFSVGPCLASVSAIGDTRPLQRLADTVADRLADPAVAAGCSA
ncbi:PQQ-binding-like beta-propeller repeat protein [Actinoplanes sp. L3-i22]|uniref:outer membrane protein assembly factor BamB family protein n=1 Tax=Actinoplanes sp. L3-i22 TaxID=2836373 RepID=UPI001C74C3F2|nr:PQQ-binding-like beta-propeller repeat protein [Actinoplanes sp. L3-i22]BCY11834.1 hypothetical protein L3i22_069220 [Actinoplanes sp. L3-i22]